MSRIARNNRTKTGNVKNNSLGNSRGIADQWDQGKSPAEVLACTRRVEAVDHRQSVHVLSRCIVH